jgi:cysteine desulfurase / selenocysteine lyase
MKTIKNDFPIFHNRPKGSRLVYLDNAATTHKPNTVLNAERDFYENGYGTVKRGIYKSGEQATVAFETARNRVASFIGAKSPSEVIFTSGATDSINLIAKAWGELNIGPGDEIVVSELEHHANLLPWQRLAADRGAFLRYIPVSFDGTLTLAAIDDLITPSTKLVAITHTSNAVGTHTDIACITQRARQVGAKILIDAAQAVPHQKINVQELGCDFLVFSGHKMFGPTGIGIAYINKTIHHELQPYRLGGGMVHTVNMYDASWLSMPHMLEAGTPPIAQALGLVAAIDYLEHTIGYEVLARHERGLMYTLIDGLELITGISILGPVEELRESAHLLSFVVDGVHAHDVAAYLDCHGIAVRAGHHCAQPLAQKLGITASVRVSLYAYNTDDDIVALLAALKQLVMTFPKYDDVSSDGQPYA